MNREEFKNKCEERGLALTERQLEQYDEYASFLVEYNAIHIFWVCIAQNPF